jgi:site-specific DNA recombinase
VSRKTSIKTDSSKPRIRCAIYTRKSSEEGLQQEFNSLDAQREAAESYIASQKNEGWVVLPERFDDGGFTGGNMERPALRQLLSAIDAGKVDCVVVYKVDRLSRSLMDFAKIMETFDRHHVSFVSVTQHFNTTHSMGRLTLNILLSFAQFEREIIGERIRDKIAASRQRGKWTGGTPILGYDVDRSNGGLKLMINEAEALRVRQIFELYLEHRSLLPVVAELDRRGWLTKVWKTSKGKKRGGLPFNKCSLYNLLVNLLYVGKVRHKKEVYPGEHEPIVAEALFHRVQTQLAQHSRNGGNELRNRTGALLRGILYCKACGRSMKHTFTTKGNKRYCYYTCSNVLKGGRRKCETMSLPAGEIEKSVVEQIACIGQDADVIRETVRQCRLQADAAIERLETERGVLGRELAGFGKEVRRLATVGALDSATTARLVELNEQIGKTEGRLTEISSDLDAQKANLLDEAEVAEALADFDSVWGAMTPREQVRTINLLVKVISAEAYTKHGVNAHGVIIDELHAQPDRELVDVLTTSTGARRQPLIIYITTADFDRESICNEKYDYACKVRDGVIDDPAFLPVIYEAARDDDWTDPAVWAKANPNLGVSVSLEYLERECIRAKETPTYENTFKRLHLNMKTQQDVRWLSLENWDACNARIDEAALTGRECYGGLDLSTTTDLSAFVLVFQESDGGITLLPKFWVPADNAHKREKRDRVPYETWARQGLIEMTPGNVIDYDRIRMRINELGQRFHIQELAIDPWNATQLSLQLQGDGFEVIQFGQGFKEMTAPTKEFEKLVISRKIRHGGNPVLRWMAGNVSAETDAAGNLKPSKKKSNERIDGIVAAIMALGRALQHGGIQTYSGSGILT